MAGPTWRSYRKESREDVGGEVNEPYRPHYDQIKVGALCRIADALDKRAENHDMLLRERDHLRESLKIEKESSHRFLKQVRALKGEITKLKKSRGLQT